MTPERKAELRSRYAQRYLLKERLAQQGAQLWLREQEARASGPGNPWGVYRFDIEEYFFPHIGDGYELSTQHPTLLEDIKKRIEKSHENGKKAVFLDVCGEADGRSLGFDHTITFSMTKFPGVVEGVTGVEGDIFSSRDRRRLADCIDETLSRIDGELVFFNCVPVEGFGEGVEDLILSSDNSTDEQEHLMSQYQGMFNTIYSRTAIGGLGAVNASHLLRWNRRLMTRSRSYLTEQNIPFENSPGNVLLVRKP